MRSPAAMGPGHGRMNETAAQPDSSLGTGASNRARSLDFQESGRFADVVPSDNVWGPGGLPGWVVTDLVAMRQTYPANVAKRNAGAGDAIALDRCASGVGSGRCWRLTLAPGEDQSPFCPVNGWRRQPAHHRIPPSDSRAARALPQAEMMDFCDPWLHALKTVPGNVMWARRGRSMAGAPCYRLSCGLPDHDAPAPHPSGHNAG